jgi:hypothetical protein
MKETIQEAAESRYGTDIDSIRGSNVYDLNTDLKRGFVEGAKYQAERSYSEEDLRNAFKQSRQCKIFEKDMPPVYETFEDWFKENKKK